MFTAAPDFVGVTPPRTSQAIDPGKGKDSGQENESRRVGRTHDMEVSMIQCGDLGDRKSFGDSDDRRVGTAQFHVRVLVNQAADAIPVTAGERFNVDQSVGDVAEQRNFRIWADLSVQQIGGFSDHHRGGDQTLR